MKLSEEQEKILIEICIETCKPVIDKLHEVVEALFKERSILELELICIPLIYAITFKVMSNLLIAFFKDVLKRTRQIEIIDIFTSSLNEGLKGYFEKYDLIEG